MQGQLSRVNVHQVQEKIGSKKELHDYLAQECGAYLPKLGCCNVYFLKSILNGEKEYLKRSDVIVAAVPQIEGLTADDFLGYAQQMPSLLKYLPDQCDWLHLDKKWICDVLMSLDNDGINQMIFEAKQKRRERLDQTQNLIVHMKPEFAQALSESLNYSVQKGKSAHLIKQTSQRKRRMKEVEEVKGEEIAMRGSKQKYLQENKRMRDDFNDIKSHKDELVGYKQLVHQLHDNGVIDGDGRVFSNQPNLDMN